MDNNQDDCIFCKIVRGDVKTDIVYNDDNFIGFLDIHPKAEGHTLIVSKKHYTTFLDIPSSLGGEIMDAIKKITLKLIDEGKADGFNVIVNGNKSGGQVVMHAHVHIIPRKEGDGLKSIV